MDNEKKWSDQEVAAIGSAVVIVGSIAIYWLLQLDSTLGLLELAYGSVKLFNNPLIF